MVTVYPHASRSVTDDISVVNTPNHPERRDQTYLLRPGPIHFTALRIAVDEGLHIGRWTCSGALRTFARLTADTLRIAFPTGTSLRLDGLPIDDEAVSLSVVGADVGSTARREPGAPRGAFGTVQRPDGGDAHRPLCARPARRLAPCARGRRRSRRAVLGCALRGSRNDAPDATAGLPRSLRDLGRPRHTLSATAAGAHRTGLRYGAGRLRGCPAQRLRSSRAFRPLLPGFLRRVSLGDAARTATAIGSRLKRKNPVHLSIHGAS